jgi:stearoyl-CoA desaturase (delta-9 desaturase)
MPTLLLNILAHGVIRAGFVTMLVYLLATTQLTVLAVTLYLHRSQTHRSVDFHPVLAHGFRFWIWLTTSMVTKEWVAIHRKHHAHSDTTQDPHSPHIFGIRKLLLEGTELYVNASTDVNLLAKYGRGTPDDWIEHTLYTPHCNWGPTCLAFMNVLLFGVFGMAIWAIQMMWIPFWAAGVVNGLGHWRGYRSYETPDRSVNLIPWGFWVGGEELHNNHHAFPSSAKFSVRPHEFDLGWLVIQLLQKLRLANVKRVACMHPTHTAKPVQLAPRVWIMTAFVHRVMLPAVCNEAKHDDDGWQALSRRLRRSFADGDHWLTTDDRERLYAWICAHPNLGMILAYRSKLAALLEQRWSESLVLELSQWIHAAENSKISLLERFARSLVFDNELRRQPP